MTALRLTWNSALLLVLAAIGFMVVSNGFVAAQRVLSWVAAATVAAVFVEPVTSWLGRFIPRVLAVLGVFLLLAFGVFGLVIGSIDDLDREVDRLRQVTPPAIERLEARDDGVGRFVSEIDLSTRADTFMDALDDRVGSASDALADNATSAPIYFLSAMLAIFLLVYGPRIASGAVSQIDGEDRQNLVRRVIEEAIRRARRTVTALLGQGIVFGLVVFLIAELFDLPAPIVLALIAAVMGALPDVGFVMGGFALVALVAALESVTAGAIVLALILALQVIEGIYVRRWIRSFGVDVGPTVVWIVALVGFTVYGPGMAFYGVIYAIFGLAVIDQVPEVRAALSASGPPAA